MSNKCALFGNRRGVLYLRLLSTARIPQMPTVLLLDRSLSMRRPVSRDHPEMTRHDLACRGLEWFLRYMKDYFPLEYTSLLTFSSLCDVVVPFTRDYSHLTEVLGEISVLDRTDLLSGLLGLLEVMVAEWGAFAPCQAVLVTDGMPGVRHQDEALKKNRLNMPFSCQLHVVCMSTKSELSHPSSHNLSRLQKLCDTAGITETEVFIPSAPLCAESVKSAFRLLAKEHFQPFNSTLKCGLLQSPVSLIPSPVMHKSTFDLQPTPEHKFPRLEDSLLGQQYPTELVICGFLDISSIATAPFYARHFVLDPDGDENSVASRLLSPGGGTPLAEKRSEESQKPSFRVLLHGSLKCESKTALIKLRCGKRSILWLMCVTP